jgi:hypothetical protein
MLSKNPEMSASKRQHLLDRLMTTAARAEAERTVMKQRFEDRLQKPTYHFLSHAITNSRNAERSELLSLGIFGDPDSPQWLGLKVAFLQVTHQRVKVGVEVLFEHLHADLVDSRGASVSLHRLKGLHH